MKLCECGCGERVSKEGNRFIVGHNFRGKKFSPEHRDAISSALTGIPHTPEHCKAVSRSKMGVPISPRTPEACAAMSVAQKGIPHTSEAQFAADEAKRGGNDICNHHFVYNHSDLSLNTVQMTRSDHMRLHQLLKKLGYIVPHINIKVK